MSEKDYTTYGAEELAQEPGFIRWVRGGDEEAARFWEQWMIDHPERSEMVESARALVRALHFKESPPKSKQIDDLWDRINEEIEAGEEVAETSPPRIRRLRWLGYVAAAVALLLLVLQVWNINRRWEVIRTEAGQRLTYVLPDSSVVELNAASTLRFASRDYARQRRVQLTGEAFFQVEEGPAFVVETDRGAVTVLGTSFNVLARDEDFVVDCFTGRVQVALDRSGAAQVLTAGRGARAAEGNTLEGYAFDEAKAAGWRRDRIYFEETSLGSVFDEVERQFDVDIQMGDSIPQREVTGFFRLVHVDSALYDLTWPLNLEYGREGRTVTIRK